LQPFVESILHPTDFSEASRVAFAHALAIALVRRARLTLFHVEEDPHEVEWSKFPHVRETLERWGLLEQGSSRADVLRQLRVQVKKVTVRGGDVADAIADYLRDEPNDLIVLATQRQGWQQGPGAARVARAAWVQALFVPEDRPGFVSPADGTLTLRRILVPIAEAPDPRYALEIAQRAAATFGEGRVEIRALHVGEKPLDVALEPDPAFRFETRLRAGDPVDEILAEAAEFAPDLMVMATDGRDGLLDVFRGSHTERILRQAPCPVATVPLPKGGVELAET
jgi:nucleotide-binding universal stress UspA family protein